ncbi:hypothetical protein D9619_006528 [Psilocybe cf. subviscida]|uniref:Uncharacterized protein n=1 Tax=Psilocybe cf. subviscida TaxID=2480587 RepID=A0A8H5B597_9AGAR|nr:hypothetical protein D9619_006528 [Psilocybe cf. subviscida]
MRCGEHAHCAPAIRISGLPILLFWPIYPTRLCLLCQPYPERNPHLDATARRFVVYLPFRGLDGLSPHFHPPSYPPSHCSQARTIIPSIDNTHFRSFYHFFTSNPIFRFLLIIASITFVQRLTDAMTRLIFLLQIDMPPLKRRRGLAGSIVNTAVSAALIGTAVGLTVYRMWRDRGKEGQPHMIEGIDADSDSEDSIVGPASHPPPPPYQERNEWQALSQPPAVRVEHATPAKGKRTITYTESQAQGLSVTSRTTALPVTPATPRSAAAAKRRREIQAAKRPVAIVTRHRRQKSNVSAPASQPGTSTKPEFDFGHGATQGAEEDGEEDQMDWIGGKLAELIEQGRRALNTEVVVMSEAPQDEVDDGTGAWDSDEEDNRNARSSRPSSRAGSIRSVKRTSKPKPIPIGVPSYQAQQGVGLGIGGVSGSPASTAVSYASASAGFVSSSVPSSSASSAFAFSSSGPVHGAAYEAASMTPSSQQQREDPVGWESPLVRESMERARARLMARRAGGAGV